MGRLIEYNFGTEISPDWKLLLHDAPSDMLKEYDEIAYPGGPPPECCCGGGCECCIGNMTESVQVTISDLDFWEGTYTLTRTPQIACLANDCCWYLEWGPPECSGSDPSLMLCIDCVEIMGTPFVNFTLTINEYSCLGIGAGYSFTEEATEVDCCVFTHNLTFNGANSTLLCAGYELASATITSLEDGPCAGEPLAGLRGIEKQRAIQRTKGPGSFLGEIIEEFFI